MSRAIKGQMTSGKGFFGDLLSSVAQPLGALAGATLGPLGGIIGGGIGSALSSPLKRLPFKQGGVVMPKKKTKKPAKGSKAMKLKMARLRAMRK